ncbi:ALP1-like protein isoform X1 [Tanacetum coccineum]|uniref:ALP1-like protein isoform X1 n=1 Tax=Tanacetum coccineum TaxID=301880 RepID=A0ABQ5J8B7_9ASTR
MSDSSSYSNTFDHNDIHDIWVAGANNDLIVLNHSPLFDDLLDDIAPVVPFEVNGVMFEKGYYLADGIYPQWVDFVKSFTVARDERNAVFKHHQESARNDFERALVSSKSLSYNRSTACAKNCQQATKNHVQYCIILHNMILKNQTFVISEVGDTYICPRANLVRSWIERCEFLQNILDLYFKHFKLSEDVVNRILQVILDLQHFKSSLFIFAATILQSSSAIHHISNIDNYVHQIIKFQSILITSSHSLWSSQSFGHQKGACPWLTENHCQLSYMKHCRFAHG